MAINLSTLGSASTTALALSNLVLVTPTTDVGYQPGFPKNLSLEETFGLFNKQLPPPIMFHYEGEQSVLLQSDITDHFIEDNTAIQDQIALRPNKITTHGFIGELNDVPPPALALLKAAAEKLTTIVAYAPGLSSAAQLAYNTALDLYQTASAVATSAGAAWSSLSGNTSQATINGNGLNTSELAPQNKQQQIFQQFYQAWNNRVLFTVQTPYAVFENMAIETLRAIQGAETNVITDFEITFKMIRIASTTVTGESLSGQAAAQAAAVINNGVGSGSTGVSVAQGLASTLAVA